MNVLLFFSKLSRRVTFSRSYYSTGKRTEELPDIAAVAIAIFLIFSLRCGGSKETPPKAEWLQDAAYGIQDDWLKNNYGLCLKKFNLKMNCGRCPAIYLKGTLQIDEGGAYKAFATEREVFCTAPNPEKVKACFLESLRQRSYPEKLRGQQIPLHLGTGLGC